MSTRSAHASRSGKASLRLAVLTMAAVLGACGPSVEVRTAVAPEAGSLAGRRTFRIVEDSTRGTDGDGDGVGYGVHDPMIANSITKQALHEQIKAEFEHKGYLYSSESADFDISYHATVAPILDIRSYNTAGYGYGYYGYRGYYDAGYCCGYDPFGYAEASYDRETVIIDAKDPRTGKLLWRGQGTTDGYDNPKKYLKSLAHAVRAVAKKFPTAGWSTPAVAAR